MAESTGTVVFDVNSVNPLYVCLLYVNNGHDITKKILIFLPKICQKFNFLVPTFWAMKEIFILLCIPLILANGEKGWRDFVDQEYISIQQAFEVAEIPEIEGQGQIKSMYFDPNFDRNCTLTFSTKLARLMMPFLGGSGLFYKT